MFPLSLLPVLAGGCGGWAGRRATLVSVYQCPAAARREPRVNLPLPPRAGPDRSTAEVLGRGIKGLGGNRSWRGGKLLYISERCVVSCCLGVGFLINILFSSGSARLFGWEKEENNDYIYIQFKSIFKLRFYSDIYMIHSYWKIISIFHALRNDFLPCHSLEEILEMLFITINFSHLINSLSI